MEFEFDPMLVVYQMPGGITKVTTFEHTEALSSFLAMLREFNYPYELYAYNEEDGFVRTVRWPAKL